MKVLLKLFSVFGLVIILICCVTQKEIENQKLTETYTLLLNNDKEPKYLKIKGTEILESKRSSKSQNQWRITFEVDDQKYLKRELLNHPFVITVYTDEELEDISIKNNKKAKSSPFKKEGKQKK